MAQARDVLLCGLVKLVKKVAKLAKKGDGAGERRVAFTSITTSFTTSFTAGDDGAGERRVCFLLAVLVRTDGGTVC